jgi:uncharacterized protein
LAFFLAFFGSIALALHHSKTKQNIVETMTETTAIENEKEIIAKTVDFVKNMLQDAEGGHDWWHINRVWSLAKTIAEKEAGANIFIVELAALLHDIADSKFHGGDETIAPQKAADFLATLGIESEIIAHVVDIIKNMSFKNSLETTAERNGQQPFDSLELRIVQDADRLDAIGAVGIARAFNYGGFKNREIYNPNILPDLNLSKEGYKNSTAPTINHFYEKLLLLKDKINTPTAKIMAAQRHEFMEQFLTQFYREWQGEA